VSEQDEVVLERVRVREVAGVFRSQDSLEAVVGDLLQTGFDRADIDLMASADVILERLGGMYAPVEDLADVSQVPRRAFVAREDTTLTAAGAIGILTFIGATAAALGVVASGGALAAAIAAAAAGGGAAGGIGTLIARSLGRRHAEQIQALLEAGGLVLWVRVRSPEQEEKAQEILKRHGAEAVRVHEIEIDKRLEDIPLSSLRPDPWLGDEPLGQP
jgi:hypothetical protein